MFKWQEEYETALRVKCPLHGDHFQSGVKRYFVYSARWLRINRYLFHFRRSEQYQRAWAATFPYWPTKEEDDEAVYLRFKNGAKYLAQRKTDPFTHINWPDHRIEGPDDLPPEVLHDIS